jgi:hypothetical protein
MKKKLLFVILVSVFILLVGCSTETPLTDEEIQQLEKDDPAYVLSEKDQAIAGKGYSQLTNKQKRAFWGCWKNNCQSLLKQAQQTKDYSDYRTCSNKCFNDVQEDVTDFCQDSDALNYKQKGKVTTNDYLGGQQYDCKKVGDKYECSDNCYTFSSGKEYLIEMQCSNNKPSYVQKNCKEISKDYSCVDGACIISQEEILLFNEDFQNLEDENYNWEEGSKGFELSSEAGNNFLKGEGFVYWPQDDAYYPASISTAKYFLTDYSETNFKIKLINGGARIEFRRNIDYSTYSLHLVQDYVSLSKSPVWGQNENIDGADLNLNLDNWQNIKIKDNNGHLQIFVNEELMIDYIDVNPVKPGKLSFNTATEDSLFFIDDIKVSDSNPNFKSEYTVEINAANEVGDLTRPYKCATLWTHDGGTIAFSSDGPTASRLQEVDLELMRVRAIGDAGWLGGGVIVTKDSDGSLNIDYSNLDETVSRIKSMGKEVFMRIGWEMPIALADPDCAALGKYWTCPPENYNEWKELVYQIVKHYNVDNNNNIEYWVVWNEPDLDEYGGNENLGLRNLDNYLKLYNASVNGALEADPTIKIGGPTIAQSCGNGPIFDESCFWTFEGEQHKGKEFTEELLNFASSNNIQLDLLVFHRYGFYHPKFYSNLFNELRSLSNSYGLNPELVLDEWTLWEHPQSEKTAAYVASSIHYQMQSNLDLSCYTSFSGFGDENQPAQTWPTGFGLAMVDGRVVKPPYFVFKMLTMLGDKKLNTLIDGNAEISYDDSVGVISTKNNNKIVALAWRYDDAISVPKKINLVINNINSIFPNSQSLHINGYLIDKTHTNAYNYYVVEGNDNNGGLYNLEEGDLEKVFSLDQNVLNNQVSFSATLDGYSVLLLEIES